LFDKIAITNKSFSEANETHKKRGKNKLELFWQQKQLEKPQTLIVAK